MNGRHDDGATAVGGELGGERTEGMAGGGRRI